MNWLSRLWHWIRPERITRESEMLDRSYVRFMNEVMHIEEVCRELTPPKEVRKLPYDHR